ncbi:MAG: MarR family transcriptional regulator [Albidovulum sp.]
MDRHLHIRELINRLARLDAASAWDGDLNPTQRAVLVYLGRANRFSKSPSHVAEYLGTTRGTISQSFKSLVQKGYVSEHRSTQDKRAIRFELTAAGEDIAQMEAGLEQGIAGLNDQQKQSLKASLSAVLTGCLNQNRGRAFGVCNTCMHFEPVMTGGFCRLLSEPLTVGDTSLICYEQESA